MVVMHEILHSGALHNNMTTKEVSFVQALKEKYVDQDEIDDDFKVPKDKSISTEITFVGFGTVTCVQKQLRRLVSIDLSGFNIVSAGDLDNIRGSLDKVMILNLANNQLTWQEIIKILSCLPSLKEIILSSNDLKANKGIIYPEVPFKRLHSLVMGRVGMNWQSAVEKLSNIWVGIDQLDLFDNQLTSESVKLSNELKQLSFTASITSLAMSKNILKDLSWIPHIGQLSNLVELDISSCQIETLDINGPTTRQLKTLRVLNISYNNITGWQIISRLNSLPNLVSLICNDNPFFMTEKLARPMTVAQIANIRTLNREIISNAFRRDSEITYVRKLFPEYKAFKEGKNNEFTLLYPRYQELVEVYELPEDLNAKPTVEDKYITVEISYDGKNLVKKLPCDMRVSNLLMLCKRLFKIRPSNTIEIACEAPEQGISYPLDQEGQTLHFFSVKTDNRLVIKQLVR